MERAIKRRGKVLWGRGAICAYLGVSPQKFRTLVEDLGLPVKKIGGKEWVGHEDLIDDFFRQKILAP